MSEPTPATPPASTPTEPPAAPTRSGVDVKAIESTLIEAGDQIEAAAKQLGQTIDEKLLSNETGRDVKQKVGSLWSRIKEKIQ